MKFGVVSLLLLVLQFADLPAQEATDFNPLGREIPVDQLSKQLRIQIEWIETSHETYTELMAEDDPSNPKIHKSGNDGPLREALAELIKKDEASILDTSMVLARSGQRAKVESIYEYIYPTEFDPPKIPNELTLSSEEEVEPSAAPQTPPNPTAFETRNVGTTVEVDPVIGIDALTIDLNMAPEIVYLTGHEEWGFHKVGESEVEVKMPTFFTMKVTTQVTTIAGQYCLIGVQSPQDSKTGMPDRERKVMVFVKCDLMVVGLPPDPKPKSSKEKKK